MAPNKLIFDQFLDAFSFESTCLKSLDIDSLNCIDLILPTLSGEKNPGIKLTGLNC